MTDHEMLELAAKAAGYEMVWTTHKGEDVCLHTKTDRSPIASWNPLTDDGDALRLAVKLHILVVTEQEKVLVILPNDGESIEQEIFDCPYAATRRAIVRAAAEIGRNME